MPANESAKAQKFREMTEAPLEPLICRMAVPTIISMLITSFYNMADTFFVGKIGTSATGAVGVVFPLMAIIQAVGFFFGQGSGNYISRQLGAQHEEEAERMASTGFFSSLVAGLLILALGLLFQNPLCHLLGATSTIFPFARSYLRYILIGAPYMTAALVLNNQLRLQGNATYAMVGLVAGGVLNIALDPLFIFVFGLGIAGAAIATILSQLVSFVLLLWGVRQSGGIPIRLRLFSPSRARFLAIVGGGVPSLCRQGLASVAITCLNTAARPFGDAAIAAMSVVTRVSQFASSALIGFGQGYQPVCGFNYGAKRYDRVTRGFWFCIKVSSGVLVALAVLGAVFAPQLVALFRADDPEVIRIGARTLRLQCLSFPLLGWVILCNMLLQNIAMTVRASIVAAARQGLFFIPLALILPYFAGLFGVQLCQPLSDLCSFVLSAALTIPVLRELSRAGGQ
ncbi:MATE family efflux transporter [Agathobaculum sp.]|uniref:MATE family efflux transporter n=1 Tax=Agathobaculum sp. TaxID=2048138 RepID=UPI002A7ED831|nr:MATE family efflux transporter [Agathobaculum sp.]MCI5704034.1 MATE family efflux transporter [Pseudoflavonifractor sp.]MDY3618556.1 MATE family efflux transporter [Agathobaculum sp.]